MFQLLKNLSPYEQVRDHVVRMVPDHERDHSLRWATVVSIAEKIGCAPQTLEAVEYAILEWVDWLNHRLLLEFIDDIPPAEAEKLYYDIEVTLIS